MLVDIAMFRQGMRLLASGVTIVTTSSDGEHAGLTATAVCSLSAEPPRLIACINRAGHTYQMISRSRCLCVNVLSVEQDRVAKVFAGMDAGDGDDRFGAGGWSVLETGAPALNGALVSFDCRVGTIIDTGSHAVILCEIEGVLASGGSQPLLYCSGSFGGFQGELT